jgi:hypothetical protein
LNRNLPFDHKYGQKHTIISLPSRIQTTLDIYAQFVPESQRRAIERTGDMIRERIAAAREEKATVMVN